MPFGQSFGVAFDNLLGSNFFFFLIGWEIWSFGSEKEGGETDKMKV